MINLKQGGGHENSPTQGTYVACGYIARPAVFDYVIFQYRVTWHETVVTNF